uniref:Core Histone H2A/H2B/H3 domain-containing protein n=1 Tax=Knipowitschia caucasica TaxID=637954 RepID=A0AAV2LUE3_KNICA
MKTPVQKSPRRLQQQSVRTRRRNHAVSMYKAHKEVGAGGTRTSDFLGRWSQGGVRRSQGIVPRLVLLRLVSTEASRLSRRNRRQTVTQKEVQEAVRVVRRKIRARPAA